MNTETKSDLRHQWQPPPRPDWVTRVNDEGRCMDITGVVPLDECSLLDAATRATGLNDFGVDDWREPFHIFIKALNEESGLNLFGRLWARHEILLLLEARLHIEATYRQHPEIDDQVITQPIIVLGQGRSGTSFLQNTLAENPDNKSLLSWEATFPCPPPEAATYKTDPRIAIAHKIADRWNRVTPTMTSMHEWYGAMPQECTQLLAMSFMAPSWLGLLGQAPSYDMFMTKQDMTPALLYHRRVLKLLQWKNPRRHWVLKDTQHMDWLGLILKVYPDACFAWPHRDPVRALTSVVSLIGTAQWGRCDHPFSGGAYGFVTDPTWAATRLNAVVDRLKSGQVPQKQIYHLLYRDLVADTMGAIAKMYQHFGIELTEAGHKAMQKYLSDNPRDARPAHQFKAGSPEMIARAREAFKPYQTFFGVPSE